MWRSTLAAGNPSESWDQFIARYRGLILAVIRRTVANEDDVPDVFAEVCAELSSDHLARLARHTDSGKARFSTWLVTVVHHQTIDWIRRRDGRRRVSVPAGLSSIQEEIFKRIICERQTHAEAYEVMQQRGGVALTFGNFMKEVTATFKSLERISGGSVARYFPGPPLLLEPAQPLPDDALVASETAASIGAAMQILSPEERLAVQLFVVEELSAASVAQTVGWPNAKTVYNRVYRALAALRRELEERGLESG